MGLINNFLKTDLSAESTKLQKREFVKSEDGMINEKVNDKSQIIPEKRSVEASALDAMASIVKGEIIIRAKQNVPADDVVVEKPEEHNVVCGSGMSYDELVREFYAMVEDNATDEELIPILRELVDKWTPDAQGIYGETRNLWQSTLAFRINRAYLSNNLLYLQEGGNPDQVNFDEIEEFEKDLVELYKVPRDMYYAVSRKNLYSALVNLYSIMLLRPGLSDEDRLKIEVKLEDARTRLAQFQ